MKLAVAQRLALWSLVAVVTLAGCRNSVFNNPVDPLSPETFAGQSVDGDGDGIGQYRDVDEIVLVSPAHATTLWTSMPSLQVYRFDPTVVSAYWVQISSGTGPAFDASVVYEKQDLPGNECAVPRGTLADHTTYYWHAKAYDRGRSVWSAAWSAEWSFTVEVSVGVPELLTPAEGATVRVARPDLDWADTTGASGYQVQVVADAGFAGTPVADSGLLAASTWKVGVALSHLSSSWWRVRARDENEVWGVWSAGRGFTVDLRPAAPTNLAVTGTTATSVSIAWTDNSASETEYRVYRKAPGETTYSLLATLVADAASHTDAGLTPAATYAYKVAAANAHGESERTAEVSIAALDRVATPVFGVAGGSYPAAQSVSITTGTNGAQIRYTTDGTDPTGSVGTPYGGAVSVAANGTLKAVAYKAGMGDSLVASATYAFGPPATPTGLAVGNATPTTLDVSWNASEGATSYQVYRSSDGWATETQPTAYPGTGTSFTDTGLAYGTTYDYKVCSASGYGSSGRTVAAASSTVSVGIHPWQATASLPLPRDMQATVVARGYVYAIAGYDGSARTTTVYYAPIGGDGTLGAWQSTTPIGAAMHDLPAVVWQDRIYILGGFIPDYTNAVQYAAVNADGTLGSWTSATSINTARAGHRAIAYGGYLYVLGGYTMASESVNDVQYAAIAVDGTVGPWNWTTSFPEARFRFSAFAHADRIYVMGGTFQSGGVQTAKAEAWYAPILSDGSIGAWQPTTSLPATRSYAGTALNNGFLYLVGGASGGGYASTIFAPLGADGSLGAWDQAPEALPQWRADVACGQYGGWLYVVGGYGGSVLTSVLYTSFR